MPRKPPPSGLPPIRAAFPGFTAFAPRDNAQRRLIALLREALRGLRAAERQPFYSQRETARFFRVPLRTVTLAYRQLAQEGLLTCLRGSATWIAGTREGPRVIPRGVVGVPVWSNGFVMFLHWRRFLTVLEEELRHLGFVMDMIFYDGGEETRPQFADRLLAHDLDQLFWLYPLPSARATLGRLVDSGVRVRIVIEWTWEGAPFPQYLVDWESAYVTALQAWLEAGIRKVAVALGGHGRHPEKDPLHGALVRTGMRYDYQRLGDLRQLDCGDAGGVIIPDDLDLFMFSRLSAKSLVNLMGNTRLMIKNGLVAPRPLGDVQADVIHVVWDELARRLAADLASHPLAPAEVRTVRPEWLPREPASRFSSLF